MYVNKWSYSSDPIKLINGTSKTIVVSTFFRSISFPRTSKERIPMASIYQDDGS
jgi:hypothetical protein